MHVNTITSPVDAADFKRAAGRFASGVTVVTTCDGAAVHGITVSAFASFSIEPLQILVSIWKQNRLHEMIQRSGIFAVSVLGEDQRSISEYFSSSGRAPQPGGFPDIGSLTHVTGAPIIDDCLAYFDCRLASTAAGGDHSVFIGEVVAVGSREGLPLLYYSRDYRGMRDWEPSSTDSR